MSDHVDGPRTTADPSIDVTDLYYFTDPKNPKKSVLVGDVFPFAGENALFSDAINHSFVIRNLSITGKGKEAGFKPLGAEVRFTTRFYPLAKSDSTKRPVQTGICTLPNGETVNLESGNEMGSYSSDRSVRIFAGVRSDPFFIGWLPSAPEGKNFVEGDNVLSIVIEFDTDKILNTTSSSLFGVIFETTPIDITPSSLLVRYDWVGRPEHTNYRLYMAGNVDIRDLWNQQTPFDIDPLYLPIFRKRLEESFRKWDLRDGKVDWDPDSLNANINVLIDDFLVFDTKKNISNKSHLEIEKSVIEGKQYSTGGGRTLNANVTDICITWLVNRDRGPFLQSPAYQATKLGGLTFPYVQPPNTKLFIIAREVKLSVSADEVWTLVGQFSAPWHPLFVDIKVVGSGVGELRTIETVDGKFITERLISLDNSKKIMKYKLVSGLPADQYDATLEVIGSGSGCSVKWTVQYHPAGIAKFYLNLIVTKLVDSGIAYLANRFGSTGK